MKKDAVLSFVALIMMLFALRSLVATDCQECCKEGRFVSTECSRNCNQCDMYDDEGAAESRDFPE